MTQAVAVNADLHARLGRLVAGLDALQTRYESARDSRAVFTFVYSIMTQELDSALDGMDLRDPGWLVSLAEAFADRYFDAVRLLDDRQAPPLAWQTVFDAIRSGSSVLEDAVFPITAHIVHDLPLALIEVGFDGPNLSRCLHDYDEVNRVMERSIDDIRQRVIRRYSPALGFLDRMESGYDLVLSSYGIRMSRAQAWYDALRIRDPGVGQAALLSLETRPMELVKSVREPPSVSLGLMLAWLRRLARVWRRWPGPAEAG
jgi:hypothetical protein